MGIFGKHRLDRAEERDRKRDALVREYPQLSNGEIIDLLIAAKWDLEMARKIVAMALAAETPLYLFLAMMEQK